MPIGYLYIFFGIMSIRSSAHFYWIFFLVLNCIVFFIYFIFYFPNTFFFLLYNMVTQLHIHGYILFFSHYHVPSHSHFPPLGIHRSILQVHDFLFCGKIHLPSLYILDINLSILYGIYNLQTYPIQLAAFFCY